MYADHLLNYSLKIEGDLVFSTEEELITLLKKLPGSLEYLTFF